MYIDIYATNNEFYKAIGQNEIPVTDRGKQLPNVNSFKGMKIPA